MTVAELIEKLKEFDQELNVIVFDDGMADKATTVETFKSFWPESNTDGVVIY